MARNSIITFLVVLLAIVEQLLAKEFLRVCYFPNWAHQRVSTLARFDITNIDPYICTHLIYAFGNIDRGNKVLQTPTPTEESRYRAFNDLKKNNTQLKTLLTVGGQYDHGEGFTAVADPVTTLNNFAATTITFLRRYGFDGLDLDWEFPNASNNQTLITLLKGLREAFDKESTTSRLLLTIAAPAGKYFIDSGYKVADINKYVDYVNVMTYDYATSNNEVTTFNSPLYSRNNIRFSPELSTNWTVHYYHQLGLDFSKILVGITGVGRWLVLQNSSVYDVGSNVTKALRNGTHYEIVAGLAYPEICLMLSNNSSKRYFDDNQQVPYLVNGDNWIGYEDTQSVEAKTKWMMDLGVAGLMFWSIDQDDFSGQSCNQGRYPLLSTARKLSSNDTRVVTTPSPVTATPKATPKATTVKPINTGACLQPSVAFFSLIPVLVATLTQ
uniref:Chitinase n=1 Tax=Lymnaea stagnalis TaxID=6523 RepID=A0A193PDF9_LYMST|nr:chitinase [Lymnaea stagnalis]